MEATRAAVVVGWRSAAPDMQGLRTATTTAEGHPGCSGRRRQLPEGLQVGEVLASAGGALVDNQRRTSDEGHPAPTHLMNAARGPGRRKIGDPADLGEQVDAIGGQTELEYGAGMIEMPTPAPRSPVTALSRHRDPACLGGLHEPPSRARRPRGSARRSREARAGLQTSRRSRGPNDADGQVRASVLGPRSAGEGPHPPGELPDHLDSLFGRSARREVIAWLLAQAADPNRPVGSAGCRRLVRLRGCGRSHSRQSRTWRGGGNPG